LQEAEALVKKMRGKASDSDNIPYQLHGKPEAIVLFTNLEDIVAGSIRNPHQVQDDEAENQQRAKLALALDKVMREKSPAGWQGDEAREAQVLNALFPLMNRDKKAPRAIFEIIKNQRSYQ
jgi:type I restriction enzyme R subunit